MIDNAIEVLGTPHDEISDSTQDGFLASIKDIWTTEALPIKDRLRDTVLLPFVERYRVKTLTMIAILVAVGALGYMVLHGEASEETDGNMPQVAPTEVIVFDSTEGQVFDAQQIIGDGTTERYTETRQEQLHVVQAGENLFRIGLRYGVSIEDLVIANNIVDRNLIWVGQQLTIPATEVVHAQPQVAAYAQPAAELQEFASPPQSSLETTTVYPQPPTEVHVDMLGQMVTTHHYCVDQYDTLFGIAQKFGVSVEWLAAVNGITDPAYITFGQFLIVVP